MKPEKIRSARRGRLREQVLTAFEGDHWVYATLICSGKEGWETTPGIFQVWLKVRHTRMHGHVEPYNIEEVPFVLFFHGNDALHGAFWHSRFGAPVSHGCLNLSMGDAEWLFQWAPPLLPEGWHAISVPPGEKDSLWVVVERSSQDDPPVTSGSTTGVSSAPPP